MTIAPPEIEAFQRLSLFMKDISIVTGHLSKMMTSNYSLSHSTSRRRERKPTARSEAWKKDHFQGKSRSYDSLSFPPTANIKSRSPRTTKDFNFKSFQRTGSQSDSKDQKGIATKQKMQDESNFKDELATNTAYRRTVKTFISNPDISTQSHSPYGSGTLEASSVPKAICNGTMIKEIITKEEYSNNFDIKSTNTNTITTNENPKTQKRTTTSNNRPLSSNQPYTNNNEIYNIKEEKSRLNTSRTSSSINKMELVSRNLTMTENNEKAISNKIENYIERKLNNKPISKKATVSNKLKIITACIDIEEDIYQLLNSNTWISKLDTTIKHILQEENYCEEILNSIKKVTLKFFYYSTEDRNHFYHTDTHIQEIITRIQESYTFLLD
ncbi:hypothetical protein O181_115425 [Austropuccinia psidii MF-1]|uniref:Uncharacterized protein n=1 Tax=Austropuccinia psidii MF-1 TaxID=1389203 RepID=A0A9Q3KAF9_9BASI|nr:hypothetical protein [Austropuccinia psidii MF-1]